MRFSHLCRTCLRSDEELVPLSQSINPKLESLPVGVAELWQILAKMLLVNEEDSSDQICGDCDDVIQRTYAFLVKAEKSGDTLRSMVIKTEIMDFEAPEPKYNINTDDSFVDSPIIPVTVEKVEKESLPGIKEADPFEAIEVKEEFVYDDEGANLGELHNIADSYADSLDTNSQNEEEDEENDLDNLNRIYECPICKLFCSRKVGLEQHITSYHTHENKCIVCNQVIFSSKVKHLAQHVAANSLSNADTNEANMPSKSEYQCTACLRVLASQYLYDEHMAFHFKLMRPCKCGHCPKVFRFRVGLLKHIRSEHGTFDFEDDIGQVQCVTCWKIFRTKADLLLHVSTHTEMPKEESCDKCLKKFANTEILNLHITERHPVECPETKQFLCLVCSRAIGSRHTLSAHVRAHRNEFECPQCSKVYQTIENLQRHVRREHLKCDNETPVPKSEEGGYKCTDCGKIFKRPVQLRNHMRIHNGEKPYACQQCPEAFRYKSMLKTHMSSVHLVDEPPDLTTLTEGYFRCEICSRIFLQKWELKKHMVTHTGAKTYQCEQCPKRFASHGNYMYHLRIHSGDTPFECEHCDRSFRSKNNLVNHVRRAHSTVPQPLVRENARPREYACEVCLEMFRSKGTLKMHMLRKHEECDRDMPKCPVCSKIFPTPSTMRLHMRKHSNERPYQCKHCPQKFRYDASLAYHVRAKHFQQVELNVVQMTE